ncbi:hypothetical protein KKD52_14765 [Myxococcota bacterium]|nr:hypothetical protein [Myxococcota bacterium]MBU1411814.1 hypothetical protein [Myxococcota bacterium]MBU1511613.1 hypothetical protein [Myxococcota bacterium]
MSESIRKLWQELAQVERLMMRCDARGEISSDLIARQLQLLDTLASIARAGKHHV